MLPAMSRTILILKTFVVSVKYVTEHIDVVMITRVE